MGRGDGDEGRARLEYSMASVSRGMLPSSLYRWVQDRDRMVSCATVYATPAGAVGADREAEARRCRDILVRRAIRCALAGEDAGEESR